VNLMKRKISRCEPGAEQDEGTLLATFRACYESLRWKLCDDLTDRATTWASEGKIDTWAQSGLADRRWLRRLTAIIGDWGLRCYALCGSW
jgi:hypothetical protein